MTVASVINDIVVPHAPQRRAKCPADVLVLVNVRNIVDLWLKSIDNGVRQSPTARSNDVIGFAELSVIGV
jgi:hypothetical protein